MTRTKGDDNELLKRLDAFEAKIVNKLDSISDDVKKANRGVAKLESKFKDLEVAYKQLVEENSMLHNKLSLIERKCWSNEQYSRRECLEFSGIPSTVSDSSLETVVCDLLAEIEVKLTPDDIVACHRLRNNKKTGSKVIVKFHNRKDVFMINSKKKLLRDLQPSDLRNLKLPRGTELFISDSLCSYYKMLWSKCKQLCTSKIIHSFWTSSGTLKLCINKNGNTHLITHESDLVSLFLNFHFNFHAFRSTNRYNTSFVLVDLAKLLF